MSSQYIDDSLQEMFIFETTQQLEQLEQLVINTESLGAYSDESINEIFRIMHTIKSSAAMMAFDNISAVAHSTEDLFFFIREYNPEKVGISALCDLVLDVVDFMKVELKKITNGNNADGKFEFLTEKIEAYLDILKQNNCSTNKSSKSDEQGQVQSVKSQSRLGKDIKSNTFKATIRFQDGCQMENIRALITVRDLKDVVEILRHVPEDLDSNNESSEIIKRDGFTIYMNTDESYEFVNNLFMKVAFLDKFYLTKLESGQEHGKVNNETPVNNHWKNSASSSAVDNEKEKEIVNNGTGQKMISVSVEKLDKLMDLVGEMVIAEAMVTQNPDLEGLVLNNFSKSARQLRKITGELQDTIMAIRMVPIGPTFIKMHRIIRDMSKKLNKEIHLEIIGEDTEVDKNIIEHIGDPLMHLVRNSIDHGIESSDERTALEKPKEGTITLEARNSGNEVFIIIKDDGKGLNKEKILEKARKNGILTKSPEEMSDREIFRLIFLPGFSTKEAVTEYSGRGVGMDVVAKNIEAVGGNIQVESMEGVGTTITLKLPLTLAIIDGMNIRVGKSKYTIPTTSIKESFRPNKDEVFKDPNGNEMIMIRGECYPILRLHEFYKVKTEVTDFEKGIIIMLQSENGRICLFADELLGEHQVVLKALPKYIKNIKKIKGLAGCALLGDGSISLILDVGDIIN